MLCDEVQGDLMNEHGGTGKTSKLVLQTQLRRLILQAEIYWDNLLNRQCLLRVVIHSLRL